MAINRLYSKQMKIDDMEELEKDKLTKEQQKELEILAAEIEAEAIQMRIDYEQTPSEESGSIVVVHENAEILDEEE